MSWDSAVKFKPHWDKIPEVILYVISKGDMTQYDIVKTIFLADVEHLEKYGRPITFDNYVAMEHGPVPSNIYNLLKPGDNFRKKYSSDAPWISTPDQNNSNVLRFSARRSYNDDMLSVTDMRLLDDAAMRVQSMTFLQTRDTTHAHPAYRTAWEKRGKSRSAPMGWQHIYSEDVNYIHDLADASQGR